jgi:hypothetical protein
MTLDYKSGKCHFVGALMVCALRDEQPEQTHRFASTVIGNFMALPHYLRLKGAVGMVVYTYIRAIIYTQKTLMCVLYVYKRRLVNLTHAIQQFNQFDQKGRYVFSTQDISKLFPEDTKRALQAGIQRLIKQGILRRATKGVFIYALSQHQHKFPLERIAKTMRRGEYSYLSLESALSEYGVISQIPMDRITVMTTGRKGEYKTPFGTIEFTHTQRTPMDIVNNSTLVGRPLRMATKQAAYRDLKRVGRNIHLVDEASIHEN